jgi:hypothetical protein
MPRDTNGRALREFGESDLVKMWGRQSTVAATTLVPPSAGNGTTARPNLPISEPPPAAPVQAGPAPDTPPPTPPPPATPPDEREHRPEHPPGPLTRAEQEEQRQAELRGLDEAIRETQRHWDDVNRSADDVINRGQKNPPRTRDYPPDYGRHPEETRQRLNEILNDPALRDTEVARDAAGILQELDEIAARQQRLNERVGQVTTEGGVLRRRPQVVANTGGSGTGSTGNDNTAHSTTKMTSSTGNTTASTPPSSTGGAGGSGSAHPPGGSGGPGNPGGGGSGGGPGNPGGGGDPPHHRTPTEIDMTPITVQTVHGPEDMNVGTYRDRVDQAHESMQQDRRRNPGLTEEQLNLRAAQEHGLDLGWQSITNPNYYPPGHADGGAGGGPPAGGTPPAGPDAAPPTSPTEPQGNPDLTAAVAEYTKGVEPLQKEGKPGEDAKRFKLATEKRTEGIELADRITARVPELAGWRKSASKQKFVAEAVAAIKKLPKGALQGAGNLVGLLLNVQFYYNIAESLVYALEAPTLKEKLQRGLSAAANIGEGVAEFEAVAAVIGAPAATAAMILLDEHDNEGSDREQRQRSRNVRIAKWLNTQVPGSVTLVAGGTLSPDMQINDEQAWNIAVAAVNDAQKERSTKRAHDIGVENGMIGRTGREAFEPTENDEDAGVSQEALVAAYDAGYDEGDRARRKEQSRFYVLGYQDGIDGKELDQRAENALYNQPTVKHALKVAEQSEGNAKIEIAAAVNQYVEQYRLGHAKGRKSFDAGSIDKLEIVPSSFSQRAYTTRKLTAQGVSRNGPTADLTSKVNWKSDKSDVVEVVANGDGTVVARLKKMGTAEITAVHVQAAAGHGLAHITIKVTEPKIGISGPTTANVGDTKKFTALASAGDHADDVSWYHEFDWTAEPPGLVSIGLGGNVTMLQQGKATITVKDTQSSAWASAEIHIAPDGAFLNGLAMTKHATEEAMKRFNDASRRAHELGLKDGASSNRKPEHRQEISTWPEVVEMLSQVNGQASYEGLLKSYDNGFNKGAQRN